MGLSLSDCDKLGIAHEHPDHPSRKGHPAAPAPAKPTAPKLNALGQNKTEASFDRYLEELKRSDRIADFRFEPLKLRLAGRTWYRIDFVVKRLNGTLAGIEVKGHMRDDAAVKLKLAPEVFPFMDYCLVRRDRACAAGWDVRRVNRSGFGLHPIGEEWIG